MFRGFKNWSFGGEGLFREFGVPEPAKIEDEDVLSGAAGIQQPHAVLGIALPFLKTEIVELPQFFRDDEGGDAVFQALLQEDEPPDAPVAVLKRVDLLEAHMKVDDVLEGLVGILVPREEFRHFAMDVLRGARLHFAGHVGQTLVITDRKPFFAAVARAALELRVEHLDIALRQRGARRFDHEIDAAEMVRGLDDIVDGQVAGQVADRLRLEDPARLLARQAAPLHVIRVVSEVDLEPVVKPARDMPAFFRLQDSENARRQRLGARFAPRTFGVFGYPPGLAEHIDAGDVALFAVALDASRRQPPFFCGFPDGDVFHLSSPDEILRR